MTKQLLYVPPEKITDIMAYIMKYVKPAYDHGSGEMRWETVLGRAYLGDVHMWLAFDNHEVVGMASTEVIDFDGYKCLHLITSSTDVGNGFEDYHYALEDYARNIGARNIQFWGRKGWSRAINKVTGQRDEKYKEVYRVFSMEINYDTTANDESGVQIPEPIRGGTEEGRE